MENLKTLPISHLTFIMFNEESTRDEKNLALKELNKRLKYYNLHTKSFLEYEEEKIKKRGFNINSYLFKSHPTMQDLMETFFKYDRLTLSEMHLCSDIKMPPFLKRICALEIKNLEKRIKETNNEKEIRVLKKYKTLLETKRKENSSILTSPDFINTLNQYSFYFNPIQKQTGTILNDTLKSLEFSDIVQNIGVIYFILNDKKKLKLQQIELLKQAKNGFIVNYESDTMKKILMH